MIETETILIYCGFFLAILAVSGLVYFLYLLVDKYFFNRSNNFKPSTIIIIAILLIITACIMSWIVAYLGVFDSIGAF
jgi:hypothetical protein